MTEQRQHYVRIDLPHDATEEEITGLQAAVVDTVEKLIEVYDYDIVVSGGAWYPPEQEESTEPIPVALGTLHAMLFTQRVDNSPIDAAMFRDALQEIADMGMSKLDLQIHLECERAVNSVALRNMQVEKNLLDALDMVTGLVGSPAFRIGFQAGTT